MTGWKKVCCAVDFSEPSRAAMERAAALARQDGAELALVHVHEAPRAASVALLAHGDRRAVLDREVRAEFEAWRHDAEGVVGRPVHATLVVGDPAAEIVRIASGLAADLLVVGTRGRHGLDRLVLGSVAAHVVRSAGCSVLVVRPPAGPSG